MILFVCLLGLMLAFTFAYSYVKINAKAYNPLISGLLSLASFLMLMPQKFMLYTLADPIVEFPVEGSITSGTELSAFSTNYTGASGILVAIIIGYLVARLYIYFNHKNFVVKLPSSVPTNVSESLSPSFLAGGILIIVFLIRLLFKFAPILSNFGDIFSFISGIIQVPLQDIVGSPLSLILILSLANLFWYFGIHPQVVYSVITPIVMANSIANITAYTAGQPMPYVLFSVVGLACGTGFGGQGATLGLVASMFTAKSNRYKEMFKLTAGPSIFNINEPLIFGMPIIMNPIFFIPMAIGPLFMGLVAWGLTAVIDISGFNPTASFPWTTPALFQMAFKGGWQLLIIGVICLAVSILIWYPFFKVADKKALKEEAEERKQQSVEGNS